MCESRWKDIRCRLRSKQGSRYGHLVKVLVVRGQAPHSLGAYFVEFCITTRITFHMAEQSSIYSVGANTALKTLKDTDVAGETLPSVYQ